MAIFRFTVLAIRHGGMLRLHKAACELLPSATAKLLICLGLNLRINGKLLPHGFPQDHLVDANYIANVSHTYSSQDRYTGVDAFALI